LNVTLGVSRSDVCSECGAYVRCCLNCEFYDEGYHNQCRETHSEYVSDREGANFCDWFRLADHSGEGAKAASANEAHKKFDELFKK